MRFPPCRVFNSNRLGRLSTFDVLRNPSVTMAMIPAAEFGSATAAVWFKTCFSEGGELHEFFQEQVLKAATALVNQSEGVFTTAVKDTMDAQLEEKIKLAIEPVIAVINQTTKRRSTPFPTSRNASTI